MANPGEGLLARQDAAEGKEAGLHHRVDVGPHARLARHLVGIDLLHLNPLAADLSAQGFRQPRPGVCWRKGAIEQKHAPGLDAGQQIEALDEIPLVAGHKRGPLDQVGGADRLGPKAQVRHRDRTRLFGVVNEVGLGIQIGALANDLDRRLVGPHRAIGTQAIKHGPHLSGVGMEVVVEGQGAVGEVVVDAHREVVERAGLARHQQGPQMVKHRLHHRRGELLRRQPVATAQHRRQ